MKLIRRLMGIAVLAAGLALPALAQACEVCFSGSPKIRLAFFTTTIFLSLLPLGMITAGILWLRRSGRAWLAEEFEDRDAPPR